jgi:hypothetical protein
VHVARAAPPRLAGAIDGLTILPLDRGSQRQRPQLRLWLSAEQSLGAVRWRLATYGSWGGTIEDASGAGLVDFGHAFQNVSPSLELDDAWVEWRGESVDVRVGNQKFAWGRLDAFQPNDLLNPKRYYDPFLVDGVEAKIAVPAVAASYYAPSGATAPLADELRATVVWVPIAVPWRFPLPGERWFPPVAMPPREILTLPVTQQAVNAPPPARRLENGTVAVRVGARSGGVDWAVSYFEGFDPEPAFDVPIRLEGSRAEPPVTVATELRPAFQRLRAAGAEAAFALGGATVRAEVAGKIGRAVPISVAEVGREVLADPQALVDLSEGKTITRAAFARRDLVEWGVGVDYLIDGYLPLLEVHQTLVLANDRKLLVPDVDTRLVASVRKRYLADRLGLEATVLWGIEAGYELVRVEAAYTVLDAVEVRAGVLGIWGSRNSLVGEFARNGEAYLGLRYAF